MPQFMAEIEIHEYAESVRYRTLGPFQCESADELADNLAARADLVTATWEANGAERMLSPRD